MQRDLTHMTSEPIIGSAGLVSYSTAMQMAASLVAMQESQRVMSALQREVGRRFRAGRAAQADFSWEGAFAQVCVDEPAGSKASACLQMNGRLSAV